MSLPKLYRKVYLVIDNESWQEWVPAMLVVKDRRKVWQVKGSISSIDLLDLSHCWRPLGQFKKGRKMAINLPSRPDKITSGEG
jgi:hypothetical protein